MTYSTFAAISTVLWFFLVVRVVPAELCVANDLYRVVLGMGNVPRDCHNIKSNHVLAVVVHSQVYVI